MCSVHVVTGNMVDHALANVHDKDGSVNGIENHENNTAPLRRSALRALIQDFDPIWFTWCMNSGALAISTHQCPYQFPGLRIISTIFYVFDLTTFCLFSLAFITRFIVFRSQAWQEITSDLANLMLCACWPVAFMTLTSMTSLTARNAYWGRYAFTIVAYVMWWTVCIWSLVFLLGVFGILIARHEITVQAGEGIKGHRLPTTVIIPAVSVSTVAVTGGVLPSYSYDISPRLAVPVIVVSFMMLGIGLILGFMLTGYLFHALLSFGWPPPPATASVFILVAPMGQNSAALQELALAARYYRQFGNYNKGSFLTAEAAVPLEAACTLLALFCIGLAVLWTCFALYAMIYRAVRKELTWSPSWNSIIFPMGTVTSATTLLATEMDSPAWRVITAALIVILVIVFLINMYFTIMGIAKGELLVIREDPRVKKKLEEDHKLR